MNFNEKTRNRILKETGFLVIASLLSVLCYMIAGTFLKIWIRDYTTLLYLTLAFYLIIAFYRWLNRTAHKFRKPGDDEISPGC